MDQVIQTAVQGLLSPGHKCSLCIEAGLVQDWVKSNCILAIVEHSNDYGLLVLISSKWPTTSTRDLSVEKVFPINDHFKCEIDPSSFELSENHVFMKVTYNKNKALFELSYNAKAKSFAAMLSKAADSYFLKLSPPTDFRWLMRYQPVALLFDSTFLMDGHDSLDSRSTSSALSLEDNFSDICSISDISSAHGLTSAHSDTDLAHVNSKTCLLSPDFGNLPRQSIAMGVTPLAARESVVKLQMAMREDDYTYLKTYTVLMGTWNVNGQSPSESLSDWLSSDPDPPDFCVVGFQELDLSTEAFFFTDTPKEEEWREAVTNGLNPSVVYKQVKLIRLIGMMIIVFVKQEHANFVKHVAAETVGTGIMGKLGNKGGVAVRLDFHRTSICFVNCHLAAHIEECEKRNQDYNDICARIVFNQFRPPKFIKDHDHIYWMGDMNYRIMEYDSDQVKTLLEKQQVSTLLQNDQLMAQINLKKVFVGFTEGAINFLPTYKYDTGTNNWDSSEKNRPPAWCDRVLWKGQSIKQLQYNSHPTLMYSDHKPVSSVFEAQVKVVDAVSYRKIYEDVMKKLDKLENEFLPQVTVDKLEVSFGLVRFIEAQMQTITIANTGQVPVQFEFKKKLNDTKCCKEFLSVNPYSAFIKPGEKCDIDLEIAIDKRFAHRLNSGQEKIYDILVLHLEGGKDVFITVSGTYEPSCFGSSLEALVRIPVPISEIRPVLVDLEKKAMNNFDDQSPPHFEIPKEIWILVNHLFKFGLTQEDLFLQPGLRVEMQKIREKLDNGLFELGACNIHSAAEAFLLFLESLAVPVIPYEFYHKCLECSNNFVSCKKVLNEIPKIHKHVFRYIMAFLRELVNHSSSNRLDAKMLSTIFGSILLREPNAPTHTESRRTNQQVNERKKATFIYHFLMNDLDD